MTDSVPSPAYGQAPQNPYGQQPQGYPAGPTQAYPAPPAPEKKKRKWPWIVAAIVVLFVIVGVTGGGDEDGATPDSASTPAGQVDGAPAEAAPGIGDEVRDGKFGFVVTSVETGVATVGDNPFLQKQALGQFVVVHLDVTNTSDQPQTYFASNQKLIDSQGREFSHDQMAAINLNPDTAIVSQINPGLEVSTTVVFDIPADAIPAELEVHDSTLSGGESISLSR